MLLRDNIYDALRSAILTCALAPGQELREQDLAARYQVSRSPVRDALLRLEKERLVTVLPRQGYRVNPISLTDATDIFGLRLVIEPACASAAAARSEPNALDAWRVQGDQDFVAYNRGFHAAVADLSGNARMAAVAQDLVDQSDRLVRVSLSSPAVADRGRLIAEHVAIIDAIQAGDAATAGSLMRAHVAEARDRALTALQTAPNGNADNGNADNGNPGNRNADNGNPGNGNAGNEKAGNGSADNEKAGNGTAGNNADSGNVLQGNAA